MALHRKKGSPPVSKEQYATLKLLGQLAVCIETNTRFSSHVVQGRRKISEDSKRELRKPGAGKGGPGYYRNIFIFLYLTVCIQCSLSLLSLYHIDFAFSVLLSFG